MLASPKAQWLRSLAVGPKAALVPIMTLTNETRHETRKRLEADILAFSEDLMRAIEVDASNLERVRSYFDRAQKALESFNADCDRYDHDFPR